MSDSPPAKRARLDTDDSTTPAEVAAAPTPAPAAPATTPALARNSIEIELDSETADSLFGTIRSTLGKVAATEPQVGITHFVGNDIPPFTGIIKHRSVATFSNRNSAGLASLVTKLTPADRNYVNHVASPTSSCTRSDLMASQSGSRAWTGLPSPSQLRPRPSQKPQLRTRLAKDNTVQRHACSLRLWLITQTVFLL